MAFQTEQKLLVGQVEDEDVAVICAVCKTIATGEQSQGLDRARLLWEVDDLPAGKCAEVVPGEVTGIIALRTVSNLLEDLLGLLNLPLVDRLTCLSQEGGMKVPFGEMAVLIGEEALLLRLVQGGGHPLLGPGCTDGLPDADRRAYGHGN
jgi:hypothetical protein